MEYTIVWGTKEKEFEGRFVELGYDKEDNHTIVNLTCDKHAMVYHFIMKDDVCYNQFKEFLVDWFDACETWDDVEVMYNKLLDGDIDEWVDDYPEQEWPQMRTEEEIVEYMDEAFDRVWLVRAKNALYDVAFRRANGKTIAQLKQLTDRLEAVERVCKKRNIDFNEPVSDWDYGYWSGILAALRWVCGDDKDFLDT